MHDRPTPADAAARQRALDIRESFIVQAPAGSGKTDLLTRRFLALLAVVDEPEEVLAITFTRAATAEMRARILSDLEAAAGRRPFRPEELPRMVLAREALAQAERRGWKILDQPQRLSVETIDSLCLRIAQNRPLLARLGGRMQPTEQAEALYALAARRTFQHLGGSDPVLDEALARLLDLRDNRLADCESLIAEMLRVRDQWQHALPLSRAMTEDDWDQARVQLQAPFQRETRRVLVEAYRLFDEEPIVGGKLLELAHYACSQGNARLGVLEGIYSLSSSMSLDHWRCLCDFLLTKEGEWRREHKAPDGFPTEKKGGPEAKRAKEEMAFLMGRLRQMPQLLAALASVRNLPPASYSEEQWTTLRHVLTVLRRAMAELRVVFAERNTVDFTENSLAALEVLRQDPERALNLAGSIRHLLVDEFQDTSRRQHELVSALIAAWDTGEHRTVFLVGDPMQSIYMFRQAEVELFGHVRDRGIGPEGSRMSCHPVQLSVNFRSHAGLTDPLNEVFTAIGGETPLSGAAAVPFVPAIASAEALPKESIHLWTQIIGSGGRSTRGETREAQQQEAREVLRVLEAHLPAIDRARAEGREYRVAVLVRARTHLAQLVPLLRRAGLPFRAVEIERLSERQELLDLRSLTRALLQPMDRIAWLAVLRAPWCGLTLADLHCLTGSDDPGCRSLSVLELIDRNAASLSPDGQRRLAATAEILRRALELRWNQSQSPSFASWIERTWRTLGGAACLDAAAYENVQVFFSLLDAVPPDGFAPLTAEFDAGLDRLFAQPDPGVSERCGIQLMTIHKAKGLGFEVVIVPGLDRKANSDSHPLACSLERVSPFHPGETEFLVAPIGLHGEETDPLYRWVRRQRQIRFDEERKRLFYVACTRARRELHLLGTAVASDEGVRPLHAGSLLAAAWPALRHRFEAVHAEAPASPARVISFPVPVVLEEVAAVSEPSGPAPQRLPIDYEAPPVRDVVAAQPVVSLPASAAEFRRPQGSRQARAVGSVVHALLQRFGPELAHLAAPQLRAHAVSLLRGFALTGEALRSATAAVTNQILSCAADPLCQWILAPHPEARSEAAWTGFSDPAGSRTHTLRADRVFRAGATPQDDGDGFWWIVDYKTAAAPSGDRDTFLRTERTVYAGQLAAYAKALRALHGRDIPLRVGLYYPALAALDYWDPGVV